MRMNFNAQPAANTENSAECKRERGDRRDNETKCDGDRGDRKPESKEPRPIGVKDL